LTEFSRLDQTFLPMDMSMGGLYVGTVTRDPDFARDCEE
jgi:hypothetical protein